MSRSDGGDAQFCQMFFFQTQQHVTLFLNKQESLTKTEGI
jgi:hypothetical protein